MTVLIPAPLGSAKFQRIGCAGERSVSTGIVTDSGAIEQGRSGGPVDPGAANLFRPNSLELPVLAPTNERREVPLRRLLVSASVGEVEGHRERHQEGSTRGRRHLNAG